MTKITRLFDFPYHQLEKYNIEDALVTKQNNVWVKTSTKEYIEKANTISRALLRLGIQKNDKIAIISSNNRTEWHILRKRVETKSPKGFYFLMLLEE